MIGHEMRLDQYRRAMDSYALDLSRAVIDARREPSVDEVRVVMMYASAVSAMAEAIMAIAACDLVLTYDPGR